MVKEFNMRTVKEWMVILVRSKIAEQDSKDLPEGLRWVQHHRIEVEAPAYVKGDTKGAVKIHRYKAIIHRVSVDKDFQQRLKEGWKIESIVAPSGKIYLV